MASSVETNQNTLLHDAADCNNVAGLPKPTVTGTSTLKKIEVTDRSNGQLQEENNYCNVKQDSTFQGCKFENTSVTIVAHNGNRPHVDQNLAHEMPALHKMNKLFGQTCLKIAKSLEDEKKFDDICLVAASWEIFQNSSFEPNPLDAISVKTFFTHAMRCKIWNWADYGYLEALVEGEGFESAHRQLQQYTDEFQKHRNEPLGNFFHSESLNHPSNGPHIDAKIDGESSTLSLGDLPSLKAQLASHCGVDTKDISFDKAIPGSITTRWIVLNKSRLPQIRENCKSPLTYKGLCVNLSFSADSRLQPMENAHFTLSRVYNGPDCLYSVPEYVICTICQDTVKEPVVCSQCFHPYCKECAEKLKAAVRNVCAQCQCTNFEPRRNEYIDKRVLPNLYVKCSKCSKSANLLVMQELGHTCVQQMEELPGMSATLPQGSGDLNTFTGDDDLYKMHVEEPCSTHFQSLMDRIEDLESTVKDEALHSNMSFDVVQAKIDGLKAYTQQYEASFCTADASIASYQDCKMPIAEKYDHNDEDASFSAINVEDQQSMVESNTAVQTQIHSPMYKVSNHKASYSSTRPDCLKPIHLAAWYGKADIIRPLIENNSKDVNAIGLFGWTPLHIAALRGNREVVFELLSHGADVHATYGPERLTPSMLAEKSQHSFISQQLTSRRALLQDLDQLIFRAADNGDTELLLQLITWSGKSCDVLDMFSDYTPLQLACMHGFDEMAAKLLQMGAATNKKNHAGDTPLHLACESGSLKCVQLLVRKKATVNISNLALVTPMHLACVGGHLDVVRELLNVGCTPNVQDMNNISPLHSAASQGNTDMIKLLLEQPGVNIEATDLFGNTPLLSAALRQNVEAVQWLLDRGANPKARTFAGITSVMLMALAGNAEIVDILCKQGVDLHATDSCNYTALHYAVRSHCEEIEVVKTLIQSGCPVDAVADKIASISQEVQRLEVAAVACGSRQSAINGCSPTHLASCFGNLDLVKRFLHSKADFSLCTTAGYHALHLAVQAGRIDVAAFLLQHRCCNPNDKTVFGYSCLHLAILHGNQQMAELLLREGCKKELLLSVSLQHKAEGLTPFLLVSLMQDKSLIQCLDHHGCNVNAQTGKGLTALHLAILDSDYKHFTSEPKAARTMPKAPPAKLRKLEAVKTLLSCGVDPNVPSSDGLTPLDIAIHQKEVHVIEVLKKKSAKQSGPLSDIMKKMNAFFSTAKAVETDMQHQLQEQQNRFQAMFKEETKKRIQISIPVFQDLQALVIPYVQQDWHNLGTILNIPECLLKSIDDECRPYSESERQRPDAVCCGRMLKLWLQGKGREPIRWQTLFSALHEAGKDLVIENVYSALLSLAAFPPGTLWGVPGPHAQYLPGSSSLHPVFSNSHVQL